MPERHGFEYAVLRLVPRIEREEFINVGVVLHAPTARFLGCQLDLDRARLRALDPGGTVDADAVAAHLQGLCDVCSGAAAGGPIARLSASERFHWLVAPRSAALQVSAVHAGVSSDPAATLRNLYSALVAPLSA